MMMARPRAFTLLEVTLAVLVGIVLLAGSAAAFSMYRDQALIQQAKTELQQIRSQLSMAAYRQGFPCSAANETVFDPLLATNVSFTGAQYYLGGLVSGTVTSATPPTAAVQMSSTTGFWAGEALGFWTQSSSGNFIEQGTAIFPGMSNSSSAQTLTLTGSTITTSAAGYFCSGLKCNLAGRDSSNLPITFLSIPLASLPSGTALPAGAGITDPFTGVYNVRWAGSSPDLSLPPTVGTSLDFEYVNSPDNSSKFGGLAMDGNGNVGWVLPSTASTGVAIPGNLPNLLSDPPSNW